MFNNRNYKLSILLSISIVWWGACEDPRPTPRNLANNICECTKKAEGNFVALMQCYNEAQALKEQFRMLTPEKNKFDKAISRCFTGAVLEKILEAKLK